MRPPGLAAGFCGDAEDLTHGFAILRLSGAAIEGKGAVDQGQGEIVIYWRPDCVFCLDLLLRLKFTRLRYRKVDIRKDPDARAFVRSVAGGNETVPTVVVAGHALVNPSKRQVIEAVQARAPRALTAAR